MIRIVDLHKSFGETVVLDGFTLDVPDGSTTVLLGRSGAGKSVLLKQLVGLLVPDQGRVEIDGQVVHELDPDALTRLRQEIGYVFQFAALFDSLTCGDNVRMGLVRQGLDADEVESRTTAALELVGLVESIDRHPAELSGGMRKRIGIARAVALRPRYILWDEPTTGLDPVTTATMDRLMMQVREELGVTSVVVSHDLKSAFTVADRVALLHEGRVREAGTVAEIQASEDPIVRQFIEGRPE
ncbi:MAG: ATP-binding cassette domain-containing protein [Gemmatimonadales bacterium]|nr:ATP-binding cassette domain-containing protein [Gemmatimonadales bacterium]PKL93972.1 MAG: ABC transporter ATP-binding protein [Gemmatimonadetes bacterium HGW-Gemmatimonadetes-1]